MQNIYIIIAAVIVIILTIIIISYLIVKHLKGKKKSQNYYENDFIESTNLKNKIRQFMDISSKKDERLNLYKDFDEDVKTKGTDLNKYLGSEENTEDDNKNKKEYSIPNIVFRYKVGDRAKILKMKTDKITVGRGVGCDLLLGKDSYASRNHAVFYMCDNMLYVEDLNSMNGTFINDNTDSIKTKTLIKNSCSIKFGTAIVNVEIGGDANYD